MSNTPFSLGHSLALQTLQDVATTLGFPGCGRRGVLQYLTLSGSPRVPMFSPRFDNAADIAVAMCIHTSAVAACKMTVLLV